MDACDKNFCKNILYLRRKHHLSQKEMAAILGISIGRLRRIERGEDQTRLHCGMLCRVCDYFALSADKILHENWLENCDS